MKIHRWSDIKREKTTEVDGTGNSLESLEDIINAMDIHQTHKASEARIEIDSEHNSGYNNK